MKKVLITIPWFLPAYRAGGPIRSIANLVEHYADASFFIFTSDTDISGAALNGIETGKWTRWNNHTHVWYATERKASQELTKQSALLKPDVVLMVGLYSWHYTLVPLLYVRTPRKIISVRGMLHPGALAQKSWKKKIYIRLLKLLEFNHRVLFHATDMAEEKHIHDALGRVARVLVAGNYPTFFGQQPTAAKSKGSLNLVTIALISPMKNILKVIQQLTNVSAHVEYRIFGAVKDDEYWDECKKAIEGLPRHIKVIYGGAVHPDKVKPLLAESHVFILPSESENFGHAIFEALSAARPVITSNHTPYAALEAHTAGINVDPDDASDIRRAIDRFAAMDAEEYQKWANGAHAYADGFLDTDKLDEAYSKLISGEV